MGIGIGRSMKRKDSDAIDQFSHDFSDFSLSSHSPARKIRRLVNPSLSFFPFHTIFFFNRTILISFPFVIITTGRGFAADHGGRGAGDIFADHRGGIGQ